MKKSKGENMGGVQQNDFCDVKHKQTFQILLKTHTQVSFYEKTHFFLLLTVLFSYILEKQSVPFEEFAAVYCMQLCVLLLLCTYSEVSALQLQQKVYQCLNRSQGLDYITCF